MGESVLLAAIMASCRPAEEQSLDTVDRFEPLGTDSCCLQMAPLRSRRNQRESRRFGCFPIFVHRSYYLRCKRLLIRLVQGKSPFTISPAYLWHLLQAVADLAATIVLPNTINVYDKILSGVTSVYP